MKKETMEQLTEWLKGNAKNNKFFTRTFNRLSKVTQPEFRQLKGAKAIFVPSKYIKKCEEYVQDNCNIIIHKKR